MKHKTWFRLVVKAIGLFVTVTALPAVIEKSGYFMAFFEMFFATSARSVGMFRWIYVTGFAGAVVQLCAGLYLFFRGQWIVNLCIPSNRPYCHDCGYDISKSHGAVCPECGARLDSISRPAPDGATSGGVMP